MLLFEFIVLLELNVGVLCLFVSNCDFVGVFVLFLLVVFFLFLLVFVFILLILFNLIFRVLDVGWFFDVEFV